MASHQGGGDAAAVADDGPVTLELVRGDAADERRPEEEVPRFGAKHMSQRIASRKAVLKPKSLEPKHPPIYPVHVRPSVSTVKEGALKVHPKGFRMLSRLSPLERNMATYFRLPPQPPRRAMEERQKLATQIDRELRKTGANAAGVEGVVLDGFMMLDATGVQDPADATTVTICDSNIVGAVADDLSYFVNVTTADFGENSLAFSDIVPLAGLETLHLHCNAMTSLAGVPSGAFPRLHTLNLSFNRLDPAQVAALAGLSLLERLDLSCNALGALPPEFAELRSLRQLALENNKLGGKGTFKVLGRLPELLEVNLNYNRLSVVPSLHQLEADARSEDAGRDDETHHHANNEDPDMEAAAAAGGPASSTRLFPKLAVLGMGANQYVYFEDLFNLSEFPSLEQVVLWGNPIESRRKDAEVLTFEMHQRGIAVVMDAPVPAKKKAAAFFTESKKEHVKVPAVDGRGLPRGAKLRPARKAQPTDTHTEQPAQAEDSGPSGPSFFMTEGDTAATGSRTDHLNATNASGQQLPSSAGASPGMRNLGSAGDAASLNRSHAGSASHRPTRLGRLGTAGSAASASSSQRGATPLTQQHGGRGASSASALGMDTDPDADQAQAYTNAYSSQGNAERRMRELAAHVDATATRRGGNIRSVMSELRSMLRQPLPPLARRKFGASGSAGLGSHRAGATDDDDDDSDDDEDDEQDEL